MSTSSGREGGALAARKWPRETMWAGADESGYVKHGCVQRLLAPLKISSRCSYRPGVPDDDLEGSDMDNIKKGREASVVSCSGIHDLGLGLDFEVQCNGCALESDLLVSKCLTIYFVST